MKPKKSDKRAPLAHRDIAPAHANRRRVLIVEPDALTQWSLRTYLEKWFSVEATDSTASAQEILEARLVDVLIVSEEFPPTALVPLEQRAHSRNPGVAIVRVATDSSKACRPGQRLAYLEKPFELTQVARLLGISENELPHQ